MRTAWQLAPSCAVETERILSMASRPPASRVLLAHMARVTPQPVRCAPKEHTQTHRIRHALHAQPIQTPTQAQAVALLALVTTPARADRLLHAEQARVPRLLRSLSAPRAGQPFAAAEGRTGYPARRRGGAPRVLLAPMAMVLLLLASRAQWVLFPQQQEPVNAQTVQQEPPQ